MERELIYGPEATIEQKKKARRVIVPEGVSEIPWCAFEECTRLEEVILPESLLQIGWRAFAGCSSLRRMNLPEGLHKVEKGAFDGCRKLADEDGFIRNERAVYRYYGDLEQVRIPEGTEEIGEGAFSGNEKLRDIVFPDSLRRIGILAFSRCSGLKEVRIPESVSFLGKSAFLGCTSLQRIEDFSGSGLWYPEDIEGCPDNLKLFTDLSLCMDTSMKQKAALSWLSEGTEREEVLRYFFHQKKKLLPEIFRQDMVSLLSLLSEHGKIRKDELEEYYLTPAMEIGAKGCTAFLLDWKNDNISFDDMELSFEEEEKRNPFSVKEMRKLWKYELLADDSIKITGWKGKSDGGTVEVPEIIGKRTVTEMEGCIFSSEVLRLILPGTLRRAERIGGKNLKIFGPVSMECSDDMRKRIALSWLGADSLSWMGKGPVLLTEFDQCRYRDEVLAYAAGYMNDMLMSAISEDLVSALEAFVKYGLMGRKEMKRRYLSRAGRLGAIRCVRYLETEDLPWQN